MFSFRRPSSQYQFVQQNDAFYDRQPNYNNMVIMTEDVSRTVTVTVTLVTTAVAFYRTIEI